MPTDLKHRHVQERCFIIAPGPSINSQDISWLCDEITIGMNLVYLATRKAGLVCRYHVASDPGISKVSQADYAAMPTEVIAERACIKLTHYAAANLALVASFSLPWTPGCYSHDLDKPLVMQDPGSVLTGLAIPLALYMGCNPIYLLGCDCEPTGHAHDDQYKTKNQSAEKFEKIVIPSFRLAKAYAEKMGVSIFNAGLGGKLEVFPRVELESLRGE